VERATLSRLSKGSAVLNERRSSDRGGAHQGIQSNRKVTKSRQKRTEVEPKSQAPTFKCGPGAVRYHRRPSYKRSDRRARGYGDPPFFDRPGSSDDWQHDGNLESGSIRLEDLRK